MKVLSITKCFLSSDKMIDPYTTIYSSQLRCNNKKKIIKIINKVRLGFFIILLKYMYIFVILLLYVYIICIHKQLYVYIK